MNDPGMIDISEYIRDSLALPEPVDDPYQIVTGLRLLDSKPLTISGTWNPDANGLTSLLREIGASYSSDMTVTWPIRMLVSTDRRVMRRLSRRTGIPFRVNRSGGRKLYEWPKSAK